MSESEMIIKENEINKCDRCFYNVDGECVRQQNMFECFVEKNNQ